MPSGPGIFLSFNTFSALLISIFKGGFVLALNNIFAIGMSGLSAGGSRLRITFDSTAMPLYTHLIWHYTIIKFKRLYQPIFSDNRGKLCRVYFLGEQSLSLPIASANQTSIERFRDKITYSQLELQVAPLTAKFSSFRTTVVNLAGSCASDDPRF